MIDVKGHKFGLLTAIKPVGKEKDGSVIWLVSCECGSKDIKVNGGDLRRGRKKTCGCLHGNRAKLIGEKFGKLLVVGYKPPTEDAPFLWECICDCGETTTAKTADLTSGSKSSCGCLKSPSLIGQKFGLLTVIEKTNQKRYGYYLWKVQCECGNETLAPSCHLKNGNKQSCGCLANKVEDLSGQKYNMLTVIQMADFRSPNDEILWKCLCDCGEYTLVVRDKLLSGHTKSCGCLKERGMERHHNWQGGVSQVTKYLRRNLKEWKQKSLESNDFRCIITNKGGRLIVHHNNPDKPFHQIVKETFEIIGIEPQSNIEHYTREQLNEMVKVCSELHFKYGLGVPLTEELHSEFHIKYGYKDWKSEDFERFVREKRGEH